MSHTTPTETEVRTDGVYLGRFNRDTTDNFQEWIADPNGTHEGYVHNNDLFMLELPA